MVLRGRHLRLYLGALAVGAVVAVGMFAGAPAASAQQQTASFAAGDNFWTRTAGVGSAGNNASIFTGGTVSFSDAAGGMPPHNVDFTGPQDPSCTGIPANPINTGWNGSCTFNSPGMYPFICEAHDEMTGRVDVVDAPGQPPPPGGNPPGGNPPGGNPGGGGGSGGGGGGGGNDPGGSPTQPGAPKISFARKQTGTTLRGSVTAAAGAKIVVTALVSNRYLSTSRPKKVKKVSVGSQTKRSTRSTGAKVRFAVKLSKAARKALKSRDKLSVTLRIVVTPSGGKATTKTVAVTLRED
jgi:plastocyanin